MRERTWQRLRKCMNSSQRRCWIEQFYQGVVVNAIIYEYKNLHCSFLLECGTIDSGEKRPLGDLSGVIDKSILQAHPEAVTWMLGAGWGHQAGSRSVQPVWFFEFPWLQYDVSRNRFRCKSCEAHSTVSYFAIVKSGNVPKQHTFVSHEASDRHQVALKAYNADPINKPMSIGMDTTSKGQRLSLFYFERTRSIPSFS